MPDERKEQQATDEEQKHSKPLTPLQKQMGDAMIVRLAWHFAFAQKNHAKDAYTTLFAPIKLPSLAANMFSAMQQGLDEEKGTGKGAEALSELLFIFLQEGLKAMGREIVADPERMSAASIIINKEGLNNE